MSTTMAVSDDAPAAPVLNFVAFVVSSLINLPIPTKTGLLLSPEQL